MGAAERGSLVHRVLQRFFQEQQPRPPGTQRALDSRRRSAACWRSSKRSSSACGSRAAPASTSTWTTTASVMRADLATFLENDSDFRITEGAVPAEFELRLTAPAPDGLNFNGYIDRIDRSPDGKKAFVIDYKTGRAGSYKLTDDDPFVGGTKLQLPVYALAAARTLKSPGAVLVHQQRRRVRAGRL